MGIKTKSKASVNKEDVKPKYQEGTKGIKTKKGGMIDFISSEPDKVKKLSDEDLDKSIKGNMNFKSLKQNDKEKELIDEKINRKWKKQGGYATGTKSIKTKKMS